MSNQKPETDKHEGKDVDVSGEVSGVFVSGDGNVINVEKEPVQGWNLVAFALLTVGIIAFASLAGIVQYALAFWFYLLALQRMPANRAGFFLLLIPVFGVAGGVLFLGEEFQVVQGIGAITILGAVFWITYSSK